MLMYAIGKGITDQITKENFEAVEAAQTACNSAGWVRAGCVMSIRRPIIHVVTRPFAKKSSYFWHKVQSDSGNTSITHSS